MKLHVQSETNYLCANKKINILTFSAKDYNCRFYSFSGYLGKLLFTYIIH